MIDTKHIILAALAFAFVTVAGWSLLAWPSYRQVLAVDREIADLRGRIDTLDARAAEVAQLAERMYAAQKIVKEDLRIIPAAPDLVELMRTLSMPVDKDRVIDQTFTAGNVIVTLAPGEVRGPEGEGGKEKEITPLAMTLTIDMVGTFDAVVSLLEATESINRLVRIGNLRLACERNEQNDARQEPLLMAVVGLEAVYLPEE